MDECLRGHAANPRTGCTELTVIDENEIIRIFFYLAQSRETGTTGPNNRNIHAFFHNRSLSEIFPKWEKIYFSAR
jgi:hypothetical protein